MTMSLISKQILETVLVLSATERAALADELLTSLDRPDPRIDDLWTKEAEHRLAAFDAGEMKSIPAEDVFGEAEIP
jgi:putative addiction module component (TIGR02574 family)